MEQDGVLPLGTDDGPLKAEARGAPLLPSVAAIRARMALAPCPVPQARRGDLEEGLAVSSDRLRPAGVLVPIVAHDPSPSLLLTRRTAHLSAHAGQVSFPGGRIEPGDTDPLDAALRETEEEIGIPRSRVEIVGCLDTYVTRTGFEVTPYVGLVEPPVTLVCDPYEVEGTFEMPISFLLDPDQPERHTRLHMGVERAFYVFDWQAQYVWGATAGMLVNLKEILTGAVLPARRARPAPPGRP